MRRRILNPEERQLWEAVTRSMTPAKGRKVLAADRAEAEPLKPHKPADPQMRADWLTHFHLGQSSRNSVAMPAPPKSPGEKLKDDALRMDARTHARMTRGKLAPEARIDLHGLTLAEAHPALIQFILSSQARGLRLVLVITGKGKEVHEHGWGVQRAGAIRAQVPHWLKLSPMGPLVQQVAEAHLRHGGSGAYYVYLRRRPGQNDD